MLCTVVCVLRTGKRRSEKRVYMSEGLSYALLDLLSAAFSNSLNRFNTEFISFTKCTAIGQTNSGLLDAIDKYAYGNPTLMNEFLNLEELDNDDDDYDSGEDNENEARVEEGNWGWIHMQCN
ncbi:hypothetical protein F0562_008438 [Nyssa sinensis]|uniref:Uncharacterized protein n=1 Tax=Nyssa sinensis TaxID=561372 RepID=A0A5J5A7U3_9ASTE|nr:hypothetical protein F0562_008438 [Nyssa sinensis]